MLLTGDKCRINMLVTNVVDQVNPFMLSS